MLITAPLSDPRMAPAIAADLAEHLRSGALLRHVPGEGYILTRDGAEVARAKDVPELVLLLRVLAGRPPKHGVVAVQFPREVLRLVGTAIHYGEALSRFLIVAATEEARRRIALIEGEEAGNA